jgi:hypothetical protein
MYVTGPGRGKDHLVITRETGNETTHGRMLYHCTNNLWEIRNGRAGSPPARCTASILLYAVILTGLTKGREKVRMRRHGIHARGMAPRRRADQVNPSLLAIGRRTRFGRARLRCRVVPLRVDTPLVGRKVTMSVAFV